jgi:Kef-type K+ transport system membrane component KefB/nucleotide-binding universal stress UspA family protein
VIQIPEVPLDESAWIFVTVMALVLLVPIASRYLRVPPIVGLVVAGMLVGPGVAGLLEYEGFMQILGEAGLLYLMFLAGLELNLDSFEEHRVDSMRFGALGFTLPLVIGTAGIFAMGFDIFAALLLAAAWASHTLLTYPTFRRHGTLHNRAVATSVGATIFTDTAALLALVIVIRAQAGDLGLGFWGGITTALGLLVAITLWALPRFGRWFFGEHARSANQRFIFAVVVLFGAAAVAELGGLEAIIGAFLAGLGMNRLVPEGSALMERVDLFGETFFIPIFLLSVGLLIEPAAFADPVQVGYAAGFIAVTVVSKFLAAYGSGRWFGWEREEIGAAYSLTVAQAAATLAIVIVGIDAGVVDGEVVNAVVLTILVIALLASWLGERYAPELPHSERDRPLGEIVIVPHARPEAVRGLSRIAAAIAREDGGYVIPLTVVGPEKRAEEIEQAREMNSEAEEITRETGGEADPVLRIDAVPETGILHTIVEHDGSMLILGWKGYRPGRRQVFGSIIDPVLSEAPVPVLIARIDSDATFERVVVLVSASNLTRGGRPSLDLALEVGRRLARPREGSKHDFLVVTNTDDDDLRRIVEERLQAEIVVDKRKRTALARDVAGKQDLVILPVKPERDGLRGAPSEVARAHADGPLIIALNRSLVMDWTLPDEHSPEDDHVEDEVEEMDDPDPSIPKVEGARPGEVDVEGDRDEDTGEIEAGQPRA